MNNYRNFPIEIIPILFPEKAEQDIIILRSPLDQFDIRDLIMLDLPIFFNTHLSYTNISLYLSIATYIIMAILLLSNNLNKIVYNK